MDRDDITDDIAVVWECPACGTQLAQLKWASLDTLPCCWGDLAHEHELAEMEQKTPECWGTTTDA
jgi:hypothetical protein